MVDDKKFHPADTNGDGEVTAVEQEMYLEFRRKELEDQEKIKESSDELVDPKSSDNA